MKPTTLNCVAFALTISAAQAALGVVPGPREEGAGAMAYARMESFGTKQFSTYDLQTQPADAAGNAFASINYPAPLPGEFVPGAHAYGWAVGSSELNTSAGQLKANLTAGLSFGPTSDTIGLNQSYVTVGLNDAITLDQAATVILSGRIHGFITGSAMDPDDISGSATAAATVVFWQPGGEGWDRYGFSENFWVDIQRRESGSSLDDTVTANSLTNAIDEVFSIAVQLPAGETPFSAVLELDVDLQAWDDDTRISADLAFENTVGFQIFLPEGVNATSRSGQLAFAVIPEPGTALLLGVAAPLLFRRHRNARR